MSKSNFSRGLPSSGDLKRRRFDEDRSNKQHRRYIIKSHKREHDPKENEESVAHMEAAGEAKVKADTQRAKDGMFQSLVRKAKGIFRRWG